MDVLQLYNKIYKQDNCFFFVEADMAFDKIRRHCLQSKAENWGKLDNLTCSPVIVAGCSEWISGMFPLQLFHKSSNNCKLWFPVNSQKLLMNVIYNCDSWMSYSGMQNFGKSILFLR